LCSIFIPFARLSGRFSTVSGYPALTFKQELGKPTPNSPRRWEVAQQADLAGRGVFSRPASGLIRVAGSADVFIYNVGLVSVGIAIALNQYYGPSLYPGAGIWLSTLLAALGCW
jgi:hypothetical protein